jgi:hypothetical protein
LHTGAPVGAVAHDMNLADALSHDAVIDAALAGRARAPLVVAAGRYL